MNVRRQYSLPNCSLILEGLSDEMNPANARDRRPLLSLLVNAECHFVGTQQKLQGGRVFLEQLVKAVTAYAQECLSGVRHPQESQAGEEQVHLQKIPGRDLHRLTWQPPPESDQESLEIDLTTVQLFDLVEAVDQFFADSRTLPDLTVKLQPLSRRYRQPDEPLVQRAVPPTLGIVSLGLAALVALVMPIPEIRKPTPNPQVSPTPTLPSESSPPTPLPSD